MHCPITEIQSIEVFFWDPHELSIGHAPLHFDGQKLANHEPTAFMEGADQFGTKEQFMAVFIPTDTLWIDIDFKDPGVLGQRNNFGPWQPFDLRQQVLDDWGRGVWHYKPF
jgi:hypothetical protein